MGSNVVEQLNQQHINPASQDLSAPFHMHDRGKDALNVTASQKEGIIMYMNSSILIVRRLSP